MLDSFLCPFCGATVAERGAGADCPCPDCPAVFEGQRCYSGEGGGPLYMTVRSARELLASCLAVRQEEK